MVGKSVQRVFERLAGLESRDLCGGNFDGLAGARILASTGSALLDLKCPETDELHLVALQKRVLNSNVNASNAAPASFLLRPLFSAIAAISSFLFIVILQNAYFCIRQLVLWRNEQKMSSMALYCD